MFIILRVTLCYGVSIAIRLPHMHFASVCNQGLRSKTEVLVEQCLEILGLFLQLQNCHLTDALLQRFTWICCG